MQKKGQILQLSLISTYLIVNTFVVILNLKYSKLNGLCQRWWNTGPLFGLFIKALPLYFTISDIVHVILIRVSVLFMTCYQQLFFQGCNFFFFFKWIVILAFSFTKRSQILQGCNLPFFTSLGYCLVVSRDYNLIFLWYTYLKRLELESHLKAHGDSNDPNTLLKAQYFY